MPQDGPLPDIRAAQGESQQVERGTAHAQANEADHRNELQEDEGTIRVSASYPPKFQAMLDQLFCLACSHPTQLRLPGCPSRMRSRDKALDWNLALWHSWDLTWGHQTHPRMSLDLSV